MTKSEEAAATFAGGHNCAQAVLSVFAPEAGLDRASAMKVACSFGGGMGRQGETCGAVTGALMAIGMNLASAEVDDAAKGRTYAAVRQFFAEFRKRHGSVVCHDLLGCNIGTEEGIAQAKATGVFKTRCPGFVTDAVQIVEGLLKEQGAKRS